MDNKLIIGIIIIVIIAGGVFILMGTQGDDSRGGAIEEDRQELRDTISQDTDTNNNSNTTQESSVNDNLTERPTGNIAVVKRTSSRDVQTTAGTVHSIPLNEILGGGPPKDGIPSIDNPTFESVSRSNLDNDKIGIGLSFGGETRFYPFEILVWHEIVNDTVGGEPVLVTYCPLCQTGVVFERRVNGEAREFGVSGQLWRSNLLMYDRTARTEDESLWSQVLGEAVVGPATGTVLSIISSDIVRWGDWKAKHPSTQILRRPSGGLRPYGVDPYGDYYTNTDVGFGAAGADTRGVHPKTFVHGVEVNGQFKAYVTENLPVGTTEDQFSGETVVIEKSDIGEVSFMIGNAQLEAVGGFWFSWVAVHPDTAIWEGN